MVMTTRPRHLRFATGAWGAKSRDDYVALARKAEDLGYAVLVTPDHFQDQLAPLTALMAAAEATRTLRVGSCVFCNDFWQPAVLAKEAATLDLLSGGRFELGLGAGDLTARWLPRRSGSTGYAKPQAPASTRWSSTPSSSKRKDSPCPHLYPTPGGVLYCS